MTANTSELATVSVQSPIARIAEHPATVAAKDAIVSSYNGFQSVWQFELDNKFGQSVMLWAIDIFRMIALPLILLAWSGTVAAYRICRNPETKAAIVTRYESVKGSIAAKFGEPIESV